MITLTAPHTITTRKAHRCAWCNEVIPTATSGVWSRSYIFQDGPQTDWMHPECWSAMGEVDASVLADGWAPGDFARGDSEVP